MKYVVIGGDAAGMSAAVQIVRYDPSAEITTLEKGATYSYAQCGLPYGISGTVADLNSLVARTPRAFREKYGIDARIHHEVRAISPENRQVRGVRIDTGEEFELGYDRLLIATGARPIIPPWPGVKLEGIYTLKTMEDAKSIIEGLKAGIDSVTIVGGGYIGLELAESLVSLGKRVRIIEQAPQLALSFDADMARLIEKEARNHGVDVRLSERVEAFAGNEHVREVRTSEGVYPTDLVIIAVGVAPNADLARGTGIHTGVKGAIVVDSHMRTNVAGIWAAGDCATHYHRLKQQNDYIPLGTHANKQGQTAGMDMAGKHTSFRGVLGTSIVKFFGLALARTGLSEREASEQQIPCDSISVESRHAARYYPESKPITIKLLYNTRDRMLLGGQVIGNAGADKRIDVLATALFAGMRIDDLLDLDLAYAPPFNGVWDPLQQGARKTL